MPQFFGAEPPVPPPPMMELIRSQVQDKPPKHSGALGVGVRQLRSNGSPPVPPLPLPGQQVSSGGKPAHAELFGSTAQSQPSDLHVGLVVPVPPLAPAAQEQTPSPGFVPPGKPGRPPTDEGCTQLEPFAELQNAVTLSHLPAVS